MADQGRRRLGDAAVPEQEEHVGQVHTSVQPPMQDYTPTPPPPQAPVPLAATMKTMIQDVHKASLDLPSSEHLEKVLYHLTQASVAIDALVQQAQEAIVEGGSTAHE